MLPPDAKHALDGWLAAAGPVGEKLLGQSSASWSDTRDAYMHKLDQLFLPAPEGVSFDHTELNGVSTMLITPSKVVDDRVLLYVHGGGYVHGGTLAYRGLMGRLATMLQARVYAPNYRQAPEHHFPTPINDTFAAYQGLLERGHDPRSLGLCGDSAGGAMVITIMRKARDNNLPLPAAVVAFSPWANLTHSGASARERDGLDPICSTAFLTKLASTFLAGALPTDPDASPVFADVRELAPTLIQIGEKEVMLSDAIRLASHLAENRVRTSLEVWPGMFHVWHLFAGLLTQADEALKNAVSFLDNAFTNG